MVRRDTKTMDMFREWTPEPVAHQFDEQVTKGGTLDVKIARALAAAMTHAQDHHGLNRDAIALAMSDYLDQKITTNMLNSYASPARTDHKITLERTIALAEITKCTELLGFICGFSNSVVVPEKYADVIRLWQLDRAAAELDQERAALRGKYGGGK
jgi:hypothetical protein